jgi:iron(III) transport system substrate-binding protein
MALSLLQTACSKRDVETPTIRVITDRTASHLEDIFKYYEKANNVKIVTNFVGDGLLARLESRPREADLVVTKNTDLLELAKQKGLLQPFSSQEVLDNVPTVFHHPQWYYVVLSYRARAIFVAKDRVPVGDIASYQDLVLPRWKQRVCIRSGFHEYNVSWWSQMAASRGMEETERFVLGLRDNLARPPKGNDRAQARAIFEDQCDLAVANSYYMGIMLGREDQKAWGEACRVVFPDQDELGTFVMRSGAALTTAEENVQEATRLLGFLTGAFAQRYFSEALFEYPIKEGVPLAPVTAQLGAEQGIENGAFKANIVSLEEAVKHRQAIIEMLTRINFDQR